MIIPSFPMTFFSKVAFPAFYQCLFTYFLLLALPGSEMAKAAIVSLAALGIPLTLWSNRRLLGMQASPLRAFRAVAPFIVSLALPLMQLSVFVLLR